MKSRSGTTTSGLQWKPITNSNARAVFTVWAILAAQWQPKKTATIADCAAITPQPVMHVKEVREYRSSVGDVTRKSLQFMDLRQYDDFRSDKRTPNTALRAELGMGLLIQLLFDSGFQPVLFEAGESLPITGLKFPIPPIFKWCGSETGLEN